MTDLVYFGYCYGPDDKKNFELQKEFNVRVKELFPEVKLADADDQIKGYRTGVTLPDSDVDAYRIFMMGEGWLGCSLTLLIMARDKDERAELDRLLPEVEKKYGKDWREKKC